MKQIPGPKSQTIRVVLDEAEMHKMLDPILKEVNSLRARVVELEAQSKNCLDDICTLSTDVTTLESQMATAAAFATLTAACQAETNELLTLLVLDYKSRKDDGK